MRALAVVLRHEIAERRLLFLGGGLLGLVPFLAVLVPGLAAGAVPDMRDTLALFLALAVSGLAALLLGATVIAGDLAEGRLGFFFSRPLPGWVIWAGKLGGATACAAAAGLLVLLPVWLVDVAAAGGPHSPVEPPLLVLWAVALPAAVLAAHAGGVMLRSRSSWLILDLAVVVAVVAIVWATVQRLLYWSVWMGPAQMAPFFIIAAGVALLSASAAQVLSGRTDLRRGHRRLSLTLAGVALAAALGFAGLAQWWLAIGPQDLRRWSWIEAEPGNRWVAVSGLVDRIANYRASFLLQPASGRAVRTRGMLYFWPDAFSANARRAVWTEREGTSRDATWVLMWLDLDRAGAEPVRSTVAMGSLVRSLALSPSGARVALVLPGRIEVSDLASGRILAAPAFKDYWSGAAQFVDENHLSLRALRLDGDDRGGLDTYTLDLSTGRLRQVATIPHFGSKWRLSPGGSRIAFLQPNLEHAVAYDLTSGRQLADQPQPPKPGKVQIFFTANDAMVEVANSPAGAQVVPLSPDGLPDAAAHRFTFPAGTSILTIVPAGPDHLLAWQRASRLGAAATRRWLSLDLRQGTIRPLGQDLQLAWPATTDAGPAPLFDDGHHLLQIDLATGTRRTLGPARPWEPGS
jgi:hypothetical protein